MGDCAHFWLILGIAVRNDDVNQNGFIPNTLEPMPNGTGEIFGAFYPVDCFGFIAVHVLDSELVAIKPQIDIRETRSAAAFDQDQFRVARHQLVADSPTHGLQSLFTLAHLSLTFAHPVISAGLGGE